MENRSDWKDAHRWASQRILKRTRLKDTMKRQRAWWKWRNVKYCWRYSWRSLATRGERIKAEHELLCVTYIIMYTHLRALYDQLVTCTDHRAYHIIISFNLSSLLAVAVIILNVAQSGKRFPRDVILSRALFPSLFTAYLFLLRLPLYARRPLLHLGLSSARSIQSNAAETRRSGGAICICGSWRALSLI